MSSAAKDEEAEAEEEEEEELDDRGTKVLTCPVHHRLSCAAHL